MARKDRIDAFGVVALTSVSLLLGGNQVLIKLTNAGLQPVFYAGLRSALAIVFVWGWMRWRGLPRHLSPGALPGALAMGVVFSAEFLLLFMALDRTTVVRSSILFYSMPIWMALMGHFGLPGERITGRKAVGLAVAFAGTVWALMDRDSVAGGIPSLIGDLCALGAAACWAGTAYLSRATAMRRERPEMQLFWMVLVSGPLLILLAPAFGPLIRDLQPIHLVGLVVQSVVIVSGVFILWLWLLTIYPASGVASFSFLSPVFGLMLGWLILGEPVGPGILGALVLVAAGIVLINRPPAVAAVQR